MGAEGIFQLLPGTNKASKLGSASHSSHGRVLFSKLNGLDQTVMEHDPSYQASPNSVES
jgi:hypothetical protein